MDRRHEKHELQKQRSREWKKRNPERHAELAKAYRSRNREKTKAQNQLNYAIRNGRMERKPCEMCGTDEKVHAHHHDYTKPYDVNWYCFLCHKKVHPVTDEDKRVKFSGYKPAQLEGSSNPNAALDDKSVKHIRIVLNMGISQEKIAKAYGVAQSTISQIKLGKRYRNVT